MGRTGLAAAWAAASLLLAGGAQAAGGLGPFEGQSDVGATGLKGSAVLSGGVWRVTGGGANIWADKDAFHYVWARRSGDLHVETGLAWEGTGHDPHRKAGPMIRQNLTAGSPYADVMLHGDGLVSLQYREVQDGPTFEITSNVRNATKVRLEKEGDYVFFSVAGADGVLTHAGGNYRIRIEGPYYAGLAVSAHNNAVTETARFSDVTLSTPTLKHIADTGYPAAVEATLEVMDLAGAQSRHVIRHFDRKIEAPNWSRDGASLIYNAGGLIWRIPAAGGAPQPLDTGPLKKNNNDHGLSFDGTLLAVSDQTQSDNQSRIYVLPADGSADPRLVVERAGSPSYWHGFSPDGRTIVFTANRPETGDYDIYAKDLASGPERRLTTEKGLDDGPEYAPDGKSIWFNSTRSGAMQVWRMDADGKNPVQVTRDPAWRDWFPHLSPDGKWVVFIAFGSDVDLSDHPPNRDVTLKIMPADGSASPKLLTKLFGGQGTINVPSWSPDGQHIAFVSYRLVR